jgi:hypothetical protein
MYAAFICAGGWFSDDLEAMIVVCGLWIGCRRRVPVFD